MHLNFERTINASSDCSILSLTWMGKVPDELPEDEGWKLNRSNYYQEGWLASGNVRGIVGVTFTTSHCRKNIDYPARTNYNLRGHRSEVMLVKWNEPYQKLASCDSSGIIFVWIKYEGRWSIELINDRNTPVTHFSWSHDGRMALICYKDGFVLVGSVAGQRYWSSTLNLDATITCGIWTPDDQQVYFGTTLGQIIVMDVHGAMVSQVQLCENKVAISSMAWSCEKFKMEESDDDDPGVINAAERKFVLAVSMHNGLIYLLKTYDDVAPIKINTEFVGPPFMEWSNSRELLAVAGIPISLLHRNGQKMSEGFGNVLKFYNDKGVLIYSVSLPNAQEPVSALTWGHNDKRLFIATGSKIHIAWISRRIATLQLLCRLTIHESITDEMKISALPLPSRIQNIIENLYTHTLRCSVPSLQTLRDFVCRPPNGSIRLHCTIIRHDDDNSMGTSYTLYLEYLGGLVPLLKGRRISKIRPEFVIFDPQKSPITGCTGRKSDQGSPEDGRMPQSLAGSAFCYSNLYDLPTTNLDPKSMNYVDSLPEQNKLVEITSNIWGTKFKIHGLSLSVPANLGQILYKTSLLHLQPRQMTLIITELRDNVPVGPDPNFDPNMFSEDEDDSNVDECSNRIQRTAIERSPLIAPMSPRRPSSRQHLESKQNHLNSEKSDIASSSSKVESQHSSRYDGHNNVLVNRIGKSLENTKPVISGLRDKNMQSSSNLIKASRMSRMNEQHDSNDKISEFASRLSSLQPKHGLPDAMIRSCSVGYLDTVEASIGDEKLNLAAMRKEIPRRLVLVNNKNKYKKHILKSVALSKPGLHSSKTNLKRFCKSKSLDSSDIFYSNFDYNAAIVKLSANKESLPENKVHNKSEMTPSPSDNISKCSKLSYLMNCSPLARRRKKDPDNRYEDLSKVTSKNTRNSGSLSNMPALATFKQSLLHETPELRSKHIPINYSRSSPSSPVSNKKSNRPKSASPSRKSLLSSSLLGKRVNKSKNYIESSDDETTSNDDICKFSYKDLETFQKTQLKQKLRRCKIEPNGYHTVSLPKRREFVMHNKAPMWNENSQVYQLDFGGRVTQESAKNFQIEFRGKQVMQFGRIDNNAYTLDFQYPFSAVQAFAVALANVTQRLK